MFSYDLFAQLFLFFSRRRLILLATTAAIIVISALAFWRLNVHGDIRSMLPDDTSEAALNFKLLQQAPFTRKVIVNLKAGPNISSTQLIRAADRLTAAMTAPYFRHVVAGPGENLGWNLLSWLIDVQPIQRQISDQRGSPYPDTVLQDILMQHPDAAIWAEGYRRTESPGIPLSELTESPVLVVYTTPSGPEPLQNALQRVKPATVVLLGINPPFEAFSDVASAFDVPEKVAVWPFGFPSGPVPFMSVVSMCFAKSGAVFDGAVFPA